MAAQAHSNTLKTTGLLAAFALVPFAGCAEACDDRITDVTWDEPGIFDAFPAPGRYGDYTVVHVTDSGNVTSKRAMATGPDLLEITLVVEDDDTVTWTWISEHRHTHPRTQATLQDTFHKLGLQLPSLSREHEFEWRFVGCI